MLIFSILFGEKNRLLYTIIVSCCIGKKSPKHKFELQLENLGMSLNIFIFKTGSDRPGGRGWPYTGHKTAETKASDKRQPVPVGTVRQGAAGPALGLVLFSTFINQSEGGGETA